MDTLKISATANGVNYLPEYLAGAAGLFADAGLAVEATPKDPWTGVIDDLESGAADLALGRAVGAGDVRRLPPGADRRLPAEPPVPDGHRAPGPVTRLPAG